MLWVEPNKPSKPILDPRMVLAPIRWEMDVEIKQVNLAELMPEPCPPDRLFVPSQFWDRLITWAHTSLTPGHSMGNYDL